VILEKAAAVLKKDILSAVRYRNGFVFGIVAPAAQLATLYYLSRAVGPQFRPEGMPYFLFLVVGTGFYTFLIAGTHSFLRTIQESQQTGTLEVLMTSSTSPAMLISLSTITAFASGVMQLVLYLGAGIFWFSLVTHVNVLGSALVFIFSVLICAAVGLFAAGLQIAIHKGSAVLWLIGSTAWLMAGTMFPVTALPQPVQIISALLPFTHSLTGMRLAVLQAQYSPALMREIAILCLYAGTLLPASVIFFSWTVQRARQFGTLSFY
jgi:ABC-2 type transport system permease protein